MTIQTDSLSARDLDRLSRAIYEQSGIVLGPEKKAMIEGRLKRRMSRLQLESFHSYCDYLFDSDAHDNEEWVFLIDAVTTNKTDFYRERAHFDFLSGRALPEFLKEAHEFVVWSAGCSSGEEPYTLAIVLSEFGRLNPKFSFRILATDISTDVLARAKMGVYPLESVRPIPPDQLRRYFLRSKDRDSRLVRAGSMLREKIEFARLNLMDEFNFPEQMDAIFCRNVIIYFDRPTQERLFQKMVRKLAPGGYLFVGHSESLHQMDLPLAPVAAALYRKVDGKARS